MRERKKQEFNTKRGNSQETNDIRLMNQNHRF